MDLLVEERSELTIHNKLSLIKVKIWSLTRLKIKSKARIISKELAIKLNGSIV
jgi:hypothetical protein